MLASYTLVDNATLTAVQRILGQVPIRSRDSIEGDLSALEQLVCAILFYEDILCIDDYKPQFKASRASAFPFITFKSPHELGLEPVAAAARTASARFQPEVRGGRFADPVFSELLERLKLHMRCTWDISSSVYYLNLKLLGSPATPDFKKYGQLCSTIYGELSDVATTQGPFSAQATLLDRTGREIGPDYTVPNARWGDGSGKAGGRTKGLDMFLASLNWMSFKTAYYAFAAHSLGADVTLHPIRHQFYLSWMQHDGAYTTDFTRAILDATTHRASTTVGQLRSCHRAVAGAFNLPFFSAWIVQEGGDVRRVLDEALSLRTDPRIVSARSQLCEIRNTLDMEGVEAASPKAQKLFRSVEDQMSRLRTSFGIRGAARHDARHVNDAVAVYNVAATFEGWPKLPTPPPSLLNHLPTWPPKGFAKILRDVTRDLATLPQLGRVRDRLAAAVVEDQNTYKESGVKALDPRYEHANSEFSSPM
jgi:hypothetical protein